MKKSKAWKLASAWFKGSATLFSAAAAGCAYANAIHQGVGFTPLAQLALGLTVTAGILTGASFYSDLRKDTYEALEKDLQPIGPVSLAFSLYFKLSTEEAQVLKHHVSTPGPVADSDLKHPGLEQLCEILQFNDLILGFGTKIPHDLKSQLDSEFLRYVRTVQIPDYSRYLSDRRYISFDPDSSTIKVYFHQALSVTRNSHVAKVVTDLAGKGFMIQITGDFAKRSFAIANVLVTSDNGITFQNTIYPKTLIGKTYLCLFGSVDEPTRNFEHLEHIFKSHSAPARPIEDFYQS